MKKLLVPVIALLLAGGLSSPAMAADTQDEKVVKSIGNQILVDYSQGEITKGMSYSEANKVIGKVDVPKGSKLNVAMNYNPSFPANFSLCAWDDKTDPTKALGYMAINGTTTASLIDCSPFSKNAIALNPTSDFVAVDRPILNTSDFGAPTEEVAPAPAVDREPAGFPLWLGILLAILGVAIAGFVIFYFATKGSATRRKEKDAIHKNKTLWTNATAEHDKVDVDYANYLSDPVQVLNYPKLNDKTDPTTKAFLSDLGSANKLRPENKNIYSYRDPSDYSASVNELTVSWNGALQYAKTKRWGDFTEEQVERLRRAQGHLNKVLDINGNENERQMSYKALLKEINGLIVLPKTSLLAIEKKSQLQLQDSDFYNK